MFIGLRQTEIHTAEPHLLEPSAFEVEMAIENLKRHRSPDIDQIPTQLFQGRVEQSILRSITLFSLE